MNKRIRSTLVDREVRAPVERELRRHVLGAAAAEGKRRLDRRFGRRFQVRSGDGADIGGEADGVQDPEPVLVEVDVGDLLDRPAAIGVVAVVVGRAEVAEHVGSGAAGERIDAEAAR